MIVLDSSVLIDVLRGDPAAVEFTTSLPEVPACSEITRVEVIRGLRLQERRATERLFATLRWIALDEAIARKAGEFGRTYARSHRAISTPDLIIAATATEMSGRLATLNIRDFPMFKGLRAPY